jgi:hypothetical protein
MAFLFGKTGLRIERVVTAKPFPAPTLSLSLFYLGSGDINGKFTL